MEILGHIEKHGYKNDTYYIKHHHHSLEENVGFINNVTFSYESKITSLSKKLENKKIFLDISKDLNSYKLSNHAKTDYESLLLAMTGMFELASSVVWTGENTKDRNLKKELKRCVKQIHEFTEKTNQRLLNGRKTKERIILQRDFSNKIPKAGYLKL